MTSPLLTSLVNRPLQIRGQKIENRLMLAPMAGLGNIAFREILSEFGGCGLVSMEMCSAKSLPHENPKVSSVFRWRPQELSSLVCQILGSEPQVMAVAARRVQAEGFWGVDINMGCSVSAICKQGAGAALLRTPELALKIVEAVRRVIDIPLGVKLRTGWQDDPQAAVRFCQQLERAGADWLVFHPRVSPDRRSRPPKWEYIGLVKQAVGIPVFGNGNICTPADGLRMFELTGCDGLSLGRMAVARPWIFAQWATGFEPGPNIYQEYALHLLDKLEQHFITVRAMRIYKRLILYLAANFTYGHRLYPRLVAGKSIDEFRQNTHLLRPDLQVASQPNTFMFTS